MCDFDFQHERFLKYKTLPEGASELHKTVRIPYWHGILACLPTPLTSFPALNMKTIIGFLGINLGDHTTPDTQIIIMNSENCLKEDFTFTARSIT